MKSYNIFVDRRLIQGDLIVVDLPLRNDIAAYDYIEIDASVKKLLGEKALIFADNTGSIVPNSYFASGKNVSAQKIEKAEPAFLINAEADFSNLSVLRVDENKIEFDAQAKEISQKIERALSEVVIGVDGSDHNAFTTAKSIGNIGSVVMFGANATEIKWAFAGLPDDGGSTIIGAVLTPPFATYSEKAEDGTIISADVRSLSYLIYSRLIRNEVNIGVEPVNAELLFSFGKCNARISVGADVKTAVQFFPKVGGDKIDFEASALPVLYMICKPSPSGVVLSNAGTAILRKFRTLAETDELGTLANMEDMSLEDIDYVTVEE